MNEEINRAFVSELKNSEADESEWSSETRKTVTKAYTQKAFYEMHKKLKRFEINKHKNSKIPIKENNKIIKS